MWSKHGFSNLNNLCTGMKKHEKTNSQIQLVLPHVGISTYCRDFESFVGCRENLRYKS